MNDPNRTQPLPSLPQDFLRSQRAYEASRMAAALAARRRSLIAHYGGLLAVHLLTAAIGLTLVAALFNQTPWELFL